jgi:DNA-directed RNA polymerase specialized sigma24 family protein
MAAVLANENDFVSAREVDRSAEQKSAHAALEMWARWSRTVLAAIGWPSSSVIARMIEYGPMGVSQSMGMPRIVERDDLCERIDQAVGRLDETEYEVVVRTYLENHAAQVTAQKCGLTYQYYRQVLSRSRQRVGDFLAGAK